MSSITIAGRTVGPGAPPLIVAELSANHNGSLERALELVDAAHAAGADAVKLQTYTADSLTLRSERPEFRLTGGLWAGRTLHDLYAEAATPYAWHAPLFERARSLGLIAFSSPFDAGAVELLEDLGCPAYKIASFELVDLPLIRRAAATGKPLVISTGMADEAEIAEALAAARGAGAGGVMLLHCISSYPAPAEDADLLTLPDMARRFGAPVGLSDHTHGSAVAVAGVALGAGLVEKHFTLRRADGGPDSAFSLEPAEFARLVADCRTAFAALGRPSYALRPSEASNRAFRRSLYFVADVPAGGVIGPDDVRSVRPAGGLAPKHLEAVVGRRTARAVAAGEPVLWECLR